MIMQKFVILFLWISVVHSPASWGQTDLHSPEITVLGITGKDSKLEYVPTVSEISGQRLERKKQTTLGETLARETGVTSSQFGPNASRPVIRGLEGDRIRVLQNGLGVLDASAASPDHAVAVDPLTIDRIEIIRGPAALLYGSSAVGGVVNLVTNRIPEKPLSEFNGQAATRYSSHDQGRSLGVSANAPVQEKWAVHVDATVRASDDYKVPGKARTAAAQASDPGGPANDSRVYNSFNRTQSGGVGTSYMLENGFVGGAYSLFDSTYGTVAEREVEIEMQQQRADLAAELRDLGFIRSLRLKNSYSLYRHTEFESGSVGTIFKNKGNEARVEAQHGSLLGFSGLIGLQSHIFKFEAEGDEAYLPPTHNQAHSVFLFEEWKHGVLRPSFGARLDVSEVEALRSSAPGETKSFVGGSFSLGWLYQLTESQALVLNGSYTERAPNYQELFANGRHVATGQNEVGDANLSKEQSQAVELSWRKKTTTSQVSAGVFLQDFTNFIALIPSGTTDGDAEEPFEISNYRAVSARLYGAEVEYRQVLPNLLTTGQVELEIKGDLVRGINRDSGDNLPRMTPIRESVAVIYRTDTFQTDAEVQRSERQSKTAPNESSTDAYTQLNVGIELPIELGGLELSLIGRVHNLTDVQARNHVSLLKDLAPLPGRSFVVGASATF